MVVGHVGLTNPVEGAVVNEEWLKPGEVMLAI
jgi:hypothetical protein